MTVNQLVAAIDALDGNDPERAHSELDALVLSIAPAPVREAAKWLEERARWWGAA